MHCSQYNSFICIAVSRHLQVNFWLCYSMLTIPLFRSCRLYPGRRECRE